MTSTLITAEQLAQMFRIEVKELHTLRRRHKWPYVRMGRNNIRFTQHHVDQIIAQHTETPAVTAAVGTVTLPGQTQRSARSARKAG